MTVPALLIELTLGFRSDRENRGLLSKESMTRAPRCMATTMTCEIKLGINRGRVDMAC